jgi:HPt (histidine-containing phosphotransfer) domain-containing protein
VTDVLDPSIGRPKPIIELFLRIGPDDFAALRDAATAPALQQAAHKLKGSAMILGLRRLAASCREIDDLAKQAQFERARALIASCERDFEATCEALRGELAK